MLVNGFMSSHKARSSSDVLYASTLVMHGSFHCGVLGSLEGDVRSSVSTHGSTVCVLSFSVGETSGSVSSTGFLFSLPSSSVCLQSPGIEFIKLSALSLCESFIGALMVATLVLNHPATMHDNSVVVNLALLSVFLSFDKVFLYDLKVFFVSNVFVKGLSGGFSRFPLSIIGLSVMLDCCLKVPSAGMIFAHSLISSLHKSFSISVPFLASRDVFTRGVPLREVHVHRNRDSHSCSSKSCYSE